MATYSFMDVTASLSGPTGEIDLGYGSASSEEGITVAMGGPKNTMTIGADGEVMHSLHADKSGTVTVNLLKTSPTNKSCRWRTTRRVSPQAPGEQRHCDPKQGERRHHHGAQRGVPETAG